MGWIPSSGEVSLWAQPTNKYEERSAKKSRNRMNTRSFEEEQSIKRERLPRKRARSKNPLTTGKSRTFYGLVAHFIVSSRTFNPLDQTMPQAIILASASPRRKELLEKIGFVVREMPANIPEERLEEEVPENYVKRLARDKVLAVVERIRANLYPSDAQSGGQFFQNELRWVVGADTVVVVGDQVLEKPVDQADAIRMVSALAGREHQVITGFCIFDIKKNKEGIQAVTSGVKFKNAAPSEVEAYVSTGESLDKAGGYAVQGIGGYLVEYINGSYTNVVGLPLCQVVEMMQELGAEDVLPF